MLSIGRSSLEALLHCGPLSLQLLQLSVVCSRTECSCFACSQSPTQQSEVCFIEHCPAHKTARETRTRSSHWCSNP